MEAFQKSSQIYIQTKRHTNVVIIDFPYKIKKSIIQLFLISDFPPPRLDGIIEVLAFIIHFVSKPFKFHPTRKVLQIIS